MQTDRIPFAFVAYCITDSEKPNAGKKHRSFQQNNRSYFILFLNYLALGIISAVLIVIYYTLIYIHELPYEAAKHRNHPHQDAIYVACWLSLFTLHAIWPLVFLWALSHKETTEASKLPNPRLTKHFSDRLAELERRTSQLEIHPSIAANAPSNKGSGVA